MPPYRVLKFTRSDDESQNVLLSVHPNGKKPLDVKIEATEGEAAYTQTLKHDKVASLRVKNAPVSESEWQRVLEKLIQQEPQDDIQASATVSDGSSISIVIRKSIQGITQRLGSITLSVFDEELDVLDWCATAVDAAEEAKKAASEQAEKVQQLQSEVTALKSQLDELIKAKDDDETALLLKFRDLLNEKKVKIREQQKIMASQSGMEKPTSTAEEPQTTLPERSRKADKSRPSKRKEPTTTIEESSDDGFEPMDVDKVKEEPEDTDKDTDAGDTASTASEDEVDAGPAKSTSDANTASSSQRQISPPKKTQGAPPPKRSLPFAKDKPKSAAAPAPAAGESETDSDDEL